ALLGQAYAAGELDVRLGGAQPDVAPHLELEIVDPEAVQEDALKLRAQALLLDDGRQRRVGQLVQVHDAFLHEVGKIQHAGRDVRTPRERRPEYRARQRQPAARRDGDVVLQVQRPELVRGDAQVEYRACELLQ